MFGKVGTQRQKISWLCDSINNDSVSNMNNEKKNEKRKKRKCVRLK